MQIESYNIDEVKRYFFYSLFIGWVKREHLNNFTHHYKDPTFRKKFLKNIKISSFVIFMFGILLGASMIALIENLNHEKMSFIFLSIFAIFIIYASIKQYILGYKYSQIDSYFIVKNECYKTLEKMRLLMRREEQHEGISPSQIHEIGVTIKKISHLIRLLSGPLIEFRGIENNLPQDARNKLEDFIQGEHTEILEYINEFSLLLSDWISHHNKKIQKVNNNMRGTVDNPILFTSKRLTSHIETLEKLKVLL